MKSKRFFLLICPAYVLVITAFLCAGFGVDHSVNTIAAYQPLEGRRCVIIDAGHGGIDGGATSCTGKTESTFNLEIARRLDDLLHLLGVKTKMIREDDVSIHTEGETIAAQKLSDLRNRTKIVNNTDRSVLISLHMNYFSDERYFGPQVFYSSNGESKTLAGIVQDCLNNKLSIGSKRQIKKASGVYLMDHIKSPGILIECGFISNFSEEEKLRDIGYQQNLCCVIATAYLRYISNS